MRRDALGQWVGLGEQRGGLQRQGPVHQRRSPAKAEHTVVEHREMFDGCQEESGRDSASGPRCDVIARR